MDWVLGVLRVRVWVQVQLFFIIGDGGTWVCQNLFLIILLYYRKPEFMSHDNDFSNQE